jgi:D-serine dehydratase
VDKLEAFMSRFPDGRLGRDADGREVPRPSSEGRTLWEALDDQHAYLDVPPESPLQVGDLIAFGISHPCTTFDKWRWMPVVDDAYRVVDAVSVNF